MVRKDKLKDFEKEVPKKDFIDSYGKEEGDKELDAIINKNEKRKRVL